MADRRLAVWTLASFHAAGFTLTAITLAHASGGLSDALPEFSTVLGFLAYGYLWGLSYLATRWALTGDVLAATLEGEFTDALLRGSAAGGLVGMATLLGPLLLVSVPDLVTGVGDPGPFLFVTAIGAGIAVAVGVVVGLVFTVLDVAALRLAAALATD